MLEDLPVDAYRYHDINKGMVCTTRNMSGRRYKLIQCLSCWQYKNEHKMQTKLSIRKNFPLIRIFYKYKCTSQADNKSNSEK